MGALAPAACTNQQERFATRTRADTVARCRLQNLCTVAYVHSNLK